MSAYVFPTYEHQYAPLLLTGKAYYAKEVVRLNNPDGTWLNSYKFHADVDKDVVTPQNITTYATVCPRNLLPNPSRPLKDGVKASTIVYTGDSGHEQRRDRSNPRRTFDLAWNALTLDQYITIRDFYMQALNSAPFLWIHPVEKTRLLVRFANEVFQGENFAHGPSGPIYKLQLSLLQVWS